MALSRRSRTLLGVAAASVTYWVAYMLVASFAFALGEADLAPGSPLLAVRDVLGLAAVVFGFPFMLLPSSPAGLAWSRQVFGDDSIAVYGLIAFNAALWGPLFFFMFRFIRARRDRGRLTSA